MQYQCPKCGNIVEEGTNPCPSCGQPFNWPKKDPEPPKKQEPPKPQEINDPSKCPKCGNPIVSGAAFCSTCGNVFHNQTPTTSTSSTSTPTAFEKKEERGKNDKEIIYFMVSIVSFIASFLINFIALSYADMEDAIAFTFLTEINETLEYDSMYLLLWIILTIVAIFYFIKGMRLRREEKKNSPNANEEKTGFRKYLAERKVLKFCFKFSVYFWIFYLFLDYLIEYPFYEFYFSLIQKGLIPDFVDTFLMVFSNTSLVFMAIVLVRYFAVSQGISAKSMIIIAIIVFIAISLISKVTSSFSNSQSEKDEVFSSIDYGDDYYYNSSSHSVEKTWHGYLN